MLKERANYIGLSSKEAEARLKLYGLNELKGKVKISPLKIFLSQFNDFITWVLIAATIISGLMGEKADAITILIIVLMNSVLGFFQEYRTEKSLEALKELSAPTAKVYRDGNIVIISAEVIVPEDFIIVEAGDRIPADGVLISGEITADESLLTGESVGCFKNIRDNKNLFMGTMVQKGRGIYKVSKTGMKTEMGKIASLLDDIQFERSPLKEKLASLGKILVILCLVICAVVTLLGILRGEEIYKMFLLGVSLAVAAIPEGLTAIVTVALALGVSRMLKKRALIRKLPSVETLGCTSIICSDKTGTLTENKMTVAMVYSNFTYSDIKDFHKASNSILIKTFALCNESIINSDEPELKLSLLGDPTEMALILGFFNSTKSYQELLNSSKLLHTIPFDSTRKMMSVVIKEGIKETCYAKGAPEVIIEKCSFILINGGKRLLTQMDKKKIIAQVNKMSLNAMRCIAAAFLENVGYKTSDNEKNMTFLGVAGITDPPRLEVKGAVRKCKLAGIKPIMITGDHKNTAFAIGKQLEICSDISEVVVGDEIDKWSDKEFLNNIEGISVFARVSPQHKLKIIKAFKKKNYIVAMTGDGVNDAPAVKEADIGIAMGISGTDVTKEAASMILLDDNFETIVAAVEEGRVIYSNIRKFIRYLLSCNLGEVLTMFLASLFNLQSPLLAIQILLVNLATDGLPAIALGVDPPDKDIMEDSPRKKNEGIFSRGLIYKIMVRGTLIGVSTLLAFMVGSYFGMDIRTCRTLTLATLIISQLIHVFECKSEKHSLFELNIFSNMYLIAAVLISLMMLLLVLYNKTLESIFYTVPLGMREWVIVLFFSGIIALVNSLYMYIKPSNKR